MKGQLEELGEETDENVENISKMQGQILNMTKGKVNIFDASGNFKSTYEIMKGIAQVWDELSSIDQANLLETIAGKNRANDVAALLSNWQNVEAAVKSASEAEGSAARENSKYVDSLKGRLDKLTTAWQSFAETFMSSDFLKGAVSGLTTFVELIEKLVDSTGTLGTIGLGAGIFGIFKNFSTLKSLGKDVFTALTTNAMESIDSFTKWSKASDGVVSSGKALASSMSAIVGGIGLAIAVIGLGVNAYKNYKESISEARQEVIQASDEFLDASLSFEQAYIKYSGKTDLTAEEEAELESAIKGTVDALGDKSSALQTIVNGSNDYLSSLEQIKNAELEAAKAAADAKKEKSRLELEDTVKGWTKFDGSEVDVDIASGVNPYSDEVAKIAKEVGKDFYTTTGSSGSGTSVTVGFELDADADINEIVDYYHMLTEYQSKLSDAGLADTTAYEKVTAAIDKMSESMDVYIDGVYEAAKAAYFTSKDGGIPTTVEEYLKMRKAILNSENIDNKSFDTRKMIANTLDEEYAKVFDLSSVEAQARKFVGLISGYGNGTKDGTNEIGTVETFLNMRTAVNNNECTVGQYISQYDEVSSMASKWTDEERNEFNTSFGLDTDSIKQQYDEVYDYLSDKNLAVLDEYKHLNLKDFHLEKDNIKDSEIKNFIDGLSAYELQAVVNLKTELDWENDSFEEIEAKIQEEAKLIEAISFDINIADVTEKLEKLNAAMSESVSGAGLTSESMTSIEDMFSDLDGYDPSKLFERTATGMRLNTTELSKLNDEFKNTNVDGLENKMDALGERYIQTREELSNLTYGTDEYNQKARDLEAIESQINATEKLIAQYDGLTNAYQEWQRAESAGNQRDMYENVLSGFETVKDELSRGWADDGTVEFLELLTGKTGLAAKSGKELKEIWKGLDDTIKHTTYSVKDFFTTDEDGNSTSKGVYNFLNAIGQMEEEMFGGTDVVKRDPNKDQNSIESIIGFDFQVVGGNEAIAEALGISEELVDIMVRAADDAGFVVSMDGTYQQLDVLKEKAQEAANELKNTFKLTDYEFNLDTTKATGEGSIAEQYEKASSIWEQFKKNKNKDGTVNMDVKGAEEAYTLISTLQTMVDQLSEPVYMELDASQVEKDMQTPLSKLQEYETLVQSEHQLQLKGTDTSEIDKTQKEIIDYFENLDDETKIKIGIDGLSREEIESKIEKGEIEIPASVDIQMDMSDDIKDMKLLMMNEVGLIKDEEVKLKVGYEIDDSLVDKLDDDKKEIVIEYIESEDGKKVWNKLDDNERKIFIDLVASGVDIETLTDDEKREVVIKLVAENEEWFNNLSDEEKQVAIDLAIKNKEEFTTLTDDEKEVAIKLGIENVEEFKKLEDEEKQVTLDIITDDKALEALEGHSVEIEAFANIFGVEKVDDLKKKLESLDDEQIQVFTKVLGQTDVEKLKATVATLDDKTVEAIAKALGEGDVEGLRTTISGLDGKTVQAIAEAFGYGSVEELDNAIANMDGKTVQAIAEALGITDVDSLREAVNRLTDKDVDVAANVSGKTAVDNLKSAIGSLKDKTVSVVVNTFRNFFGGGDDEGGGGVDGTAHVDGTAFVDGTTGRAFKQGNWGAKDSGVALGGEEDPELLVRNGRWHLIGEKGAEFFGYRKGDIIFNASQTKEIFEKGKITHGNGRGKALVSGTAFSKGTGGGFWEEETTTTTTTKKKSSGSSSGSSKSSSSSGKKSSSKSSSSSSSKSSSSSSSKASEEAEKFEETIDWIETKIARIERVIDQLDTKASSVYRSWSERNSALANQISEVGNEIDIQQKAYDRYMQEANSIGLSETYASKVRNGTIDIETITDESLKEKIDDYQKYFEAALDCKDAIEELRETESKLYAQRFENVQTQYDGILQGYEHTEAMLNEYISQAEENGYIVSKKYYQALINNEKANIAELKKQQSELIAKRDEAVDSGAIVKNSEEWLNMCASIDEVTQSIESSTTALLEFDNAMRDIDWSIFDLIQERISAVSEEADFLIELMSNDKLFDDNGKFTEQGVATVGLHALNYNTSMYSADEYGAEVAKLDAQISKDPYDQELINRRNELLELQRESILQAEQEKDAIKDLVEESINLELDALQERIDLHNEELDSMKDLYDYQKNVEEQTSNIASLRKQLNSYDGDDSEESKKRIQELKLELQTAEDDLIETEYEKFISDSEILLSSLYDEYELILNQRLDNIDFLLQQVIDGINMAAGADGTITSALGADGAIAAALGNSTTTIGETLKTEVGNVGTKLSTAMSSIWLGDGSGKAIIDLYGKDFQTKATTTNDALNKIKADVNAMVDDVDKDAKKKTTSNKTTTSAKKDPTKTSTSSSSSSNKNNNTTNKTNTSSGDGKPKVGDKVKFVSGQYYYDSQGKSPLGSKYQGKEVYITHINTSSWATHPYHISTGKTLGSGDLGWLKLNQLSGYASGKKNLSDDEIAWTQEDNKREFIVRPSDGAILTPIAKKDSILNANASNNIWDMANSPAEFIKENLNLGGTNIPNNSNVQNNYTQNLDKVIFSFPDMKNYDDILSAIQKDKNFERLIHAMTVDRLAGKSSLAKGKAIR